MGLRDVTVLPGSVTGFLHSLEQINLPSLCFVCISVIREISHMLCPFWFLCLNFPGLGPSLPGLQHFAQGGPTLLSNIRHLDFQKVPNPGSNM